MINYYQGKTFKLCKTCTPNQIDFINTQMPATDLIQRLYQTLKNGSKLNENLNFHNASGRKSNYNQIPLDISSFYENDYYRNQVSEVVGEEVFFADKDEQYRIFARLYEDGDFLDWHYDNNFTIGNRYTLVIPILIENNTSEFMIKDIKTGEEKVIHIPIGKGVVYNGSITYHKISKQNKGGIRIVVVIPFYTDKTKTLFGKIREKVRNVTYKYLTL